MMNLNTYKYYNDMVQDFGASIIGDIKQFECNSPKNINETKYIQRK